MKIRRKSATQLANIRKAAAERHAMNKTHAEAIRYGILFRRHVEKKAVKTPIFPEGEVVEEHISVIHNLRKVIWRKF